jgi:hypothetical protein
MAKWLDLEALVQEMLDTPQVDPKCLTVWGGEFEFAAEMLEAFLEAWNLPQASMPWSLWQWTDDIDMDHQGAPPSDLDYLERGRIFGKQGDLELRRNGDQVLWRFIGVADDSDPLPAGVKSPDYGATNYWDEHEGRYLRPYIRTALLWGADEEGDGRWYEDRVGRADLNYPEMEGNQVVLVRYIEYLHGSNVELVRLLRLEPGPERPKGGSHA